MEFDAKIRGQGAVIFCCAKTMTYARCLTAKTAQAYENKGKKGQVSEGSFAKMAENDPKNVRHFVRHMSDTWPFLSIKSATYLCLTKCLTLSDRCQTSAVCLVGVSVGHPTPDTPDSHQTKGVFRHA